MSANSWIAKNRWHNLYEMEGKLDEILRKLEKLDTLETKLDDLKNNTSQELEEQSKRIANLERKAQADRRRNIIVFGLQSQNYTDKITEIEEVVKFIIPDFRRYDIADIRNAKSTNGNDFTIVTFASTLFKIEIMRRKNTLKNHQLFKNIIIKEDLSKEVREIRRDLFKHLIEKQKAGHKVSIRYDKLMIDGNRFTLDELNNAKKDESRFKRPFNHLTPEKEDTNPKKKDNKAGRSRSRSQSLDKFFSKKKTQEDSGQCNPKQKENAEDSDESSTSHHSTHSSVR